MINVKNHYFLSNKFNYYFIFLYQSMDIIKVNLNKMGQDIVSTSIINSYVMYTYTIQLQHFVRHICQYLHFYPIILFLFQFQVKYYSFIILCKVYYCLDHIYRNIGSVFDRVENIGCLSLYILQNLCIRLVNIRHRVQ